MARNNPLRGHYTEVGTDLVRAGIRLLAGQVVIAREDTGAPIPVLDPRTQRWVSSRAVTSAAAKAGVPVSMSAIPTALLAPFLMQDPRCVIRVTEEAIVAIAGGETPANRAFAIKQVELLEDSYKAAPAVVKAA